MGILLSALAGGAKGYDEAMDQDRKLRDQKEMAGFNSNLEQQRQQALVLFKQGQDDQQRQAMTGRIDAAASGIADQAVGAKRGILESGIVDRDAWTPEQQAAVDQSLAMDRSKLATDPRTRRDAAIATGDISPKDAATMQDSERRLDREENRVAASSVAAERKDERERLRLDEQGRHNKESERLQGERIDAMLTRIEKGGSSNPTKEALAFIDGQRKDLASEAQNLRALYQAETKDVSSKKRAEIEAAYAPKFEAVERKRAQVESDFGALRERIGLPSAGERDTKRSVDAVAPAASAAALPASSQRNGEKPGILDGDPKELSYRRGMLQKELDKAIASGNQGDADAVRKEIARLPGGGGASPAAAPAAPRAPVMPALPAGSRQIGTSGGKPVYQTPDGKKFVQQ